MSNRLLDKISPIYARSEIMKSIMKSNLTEIELVETLTSLVQDQAFVKKATWGINLWEEELGIDNPSSDLESRRAAVLSKIRTRAPVNLHTVEGALTAFARTNVTVNEIISEYMLVIEFFKRPDVSVDGVIRTLDSIKPAHLGYNIKTSEEHLAKCFTGSTSRLRQKLSINQENSDTSTINKMSIGLCTTNLQKNSLRHIPSETRLDRSKLSASLTRGSSRLSLRQKQENIEVNGTTNMTIVGRVRELITLRHECEDISLVDSLFSSSTARLTSKTTLQEVQE